MALDLILGNEDGRFAYDAQARTISTVATFDYEDTSQHPLLFRASDCQDPPACTIESLESIGGTTVCVLDVNEAPTVHVPAAELRVSTRAEAGSVIYRGITVSDPENHPVALSFSAGTGADLFAFEGTSTDVMLASVISGATGVYDLTIRACDVPGPVPVGIGQCIGKVRARPYDSQCSTRSLRIRVTNEDIQPPAQPGSIVVSQTRSQTQSQSQTQIMSDIDIAWNRPSNADYSHTLIRWTDRNGVDQERRFDADTSIGNQPPLAARARKSSLALRARTAPPGDDQRRHRRQSIGAGARACADRCRRESTYTPAQRPAADRSTQIRC